jgi:hypothetical protein
MTLSVTFQSEILGSGEFWRGDAEKISEIRNIPAREAAKHVARDGQTRFVGMWKVEKVD